MQKLAFAALVAVFSLIWSSAFIAAAIALEDFDPFTLLVVRFALGAAILLPFCLLNRELFDARVIRHGLLLGLLNNAIYLGLSFSALRTLRPEVVIVIISCAPFATTLLAVWLGLETFSMKMLTGIVLGFLGVVVMSGIASAQRPDIWGFLLAVAAMLAFTAGTVLFRRKAGELPVLKINFWQSTAGALALLPLAIAFGSPLHIPAPASIAAVLYLALVVTIGGMALWLVLIRTSGATTAASYHLLNPFFGVLLAHLVLGEELRTTDFIGAALIAVGLALTTGGNRRLKSCPTQARH